MASGLFHGRQERRGRIAGTDAELRLYGPRATAILLHDTELEHPDGAPLEPAYPVKRAVEEWCAEVGRSWTNRENCYGLGIIA